MFRPPFAASSMASERPYRSDDLDGLKKAELVNLVRRQLHKWPEKNFNASKTRIEVLKRHLLSSGFTTDNPGEDDQEGFEEQMTIVESVSNVQSAGIHDFGDPPTDTDTSNAVLAELPNTHIVGPQLQTERSLRLLIEDRRSMPDMGRTTELIRLHPIQVHANGDWDIRTRDLLRELQKSNASIEGLVKMSYPDPQVPKYNLIFVKMIQDNVALEDAASMLDTMTVSVLSNVLNLTVEHANNAVYSQSLAAAESSSQEHRNPAQPEAISINNSPALASQMTENRKGKAQDDETEEQVIQWLKGKVATRTGYFEFCSSQHKKLTNPARVKFWLFAAGFSHDYYKTSLVVSEQNTKVTKKAIKAALGIGTTALSEAENMARIIRLFGGGGPRASEEVISVLNQEEISQSGELSAFLVQ